MGVEGVNLYLPDNVLFLNDEGAQKLVKIICYQDGDQEFQMAVAMQAKRKGQEISCPPECNDYFWSGS